MTENVTVGTIRVSSDRGGTEEDGNKFLPLLLPTGLAIFRGKSAWLSVSAKQCKSKADGGILYAAITIKL